MKNVVYTEKIRINGLPLSNPFKSLAELKSWLRKTLKTYNKLIWRVEEFQGEKQLCIIG